MEVLHIVGKKLEKVEPEDGEYTFIDGDVYVVDNGNDIYIWLGKDSSVDEKTVGAWVSNRLDNEERGGEPTVISVDQDDEPGEFKELLDFNVIDDDTPGFLRHAELDLVEYKLYRVYIKNETDQIDEASVEEVPLEKGSLKSEDVFVLDGNEHIYMWIGSDAQREEQFEGQRLMQAIDSERNFLPLTYTIYEGEGGKSEKAFFEMLEVASQSEGPVVSVEDQRELEYKPEGYKDAKQARSGDKSIKSDKKPEKKGFWAKIFSWFS